MRINRVCVFLGAATEGWTEGQRVLTAVSPSACWQSGHTGPGALRDGSAESADQSWPLLRPTLTRQPAVPAPAPESVLPG